MQSNDWCAWRRRDIGIWSSDDAELNYGHEHHLAEEGDDDDDVTVTIIRKQLNYNMKSITAAWEHFRGFLKLKIVVHIDTTILRNLTETIVGVLTDFHTFTRRTRHNCTHRFTGAYKCLPIYFVEEVAGGITCAWLSKNTCSGSPRVMFESPTRFRAGILE
jgi:hypothetical protein